MWMAIEDMEHDPALRLDGGGRVWTSAAVPERHRRWPTAADPVWALSEANTLTRIDTGQPGTDDR